MSDDDEKRSLDLLEANHTFPGDFHVTVIALNSDRYIEAYLAVWWAGGVIVPGNTRWALAEHVYAMQDSGARFLVVDRNFAAMAAPLNEACALHGVFFMDDGAAPDGTTSKMTSRATTSSSSMSTSTMATARPIMCRSASTFPRTANRG